MTDIEAERLVVGRLQHWRQCKTGHPLFIGIGGGSASGKSTLAKALVEQLNPLAVEVIGQDRFFKPAGELPSYPSATRTTPWPDYNRPDSFRTAELLDYCRAVNRVKVVILEGILVLSDPELRAMLDLRLYVTAEADERIVRRIRRNLAAGMKLDDICDYYLESVRFQHARYNSPTQRHADLLIPGGAAEAEVRKALVEMICRTIHQCLA